MKFLLAFLLVVGSGVALLRYDFVQEDKARLHQSCLIALGAEPPAYSFMQPWQPNKVVWAETYDIGGFNFNPSPDGAIDIQDSSTRAYLRYKAAYEAPPGTVRLITLPEVGSTDEFDFHKAQSVAPQIKLVSSLNHSVSHEPILWVDLKADGGSWQISGPCGTANVQARYTGQKGRLQVTSHWSVGGKSGNRLWTYDVTQAQQEAQKLEQQKIDGERAIFERWLRKQNPEAAAQAEFWKRRFADLPSDDLPGLPRQRIIELAREFGYGAQLIQPKIQ